jgi:hypothetical protein
LGFFWSSFEEEEKEEEVVVDMLERAKWKEEGVDVPVNAEDCACDDPNRQGRRAQARRICILRGAVECILLILMVALRLLLILAACIL